MVGVAWFVEMCIFVISSVHSHESREPWWRQGIAKPQTAALLFIQFPKDSPRDGMGDERCKRFAKG
jgi:hypothetical protein